MDENKETPHGSKLRALLTNNKLPITDKKRVEEAIERYGAWIRDLKSFGGSKKELLTNLVGSLNNYKNFIEIDLIYDAQDDFLYRQKGQLKLDNTILEEFLPYLFNPILVPGISRTDSLICGPRASFAGLSFGSPLLPVDAGGVFLKLKDQDFSVSRSHILSISDSANRDKVYMANFEVSHFAAEIKTNLDKTMFQEASQTAAELKRAVPGSRYILLCEYLDMTPITTKLTSIDEVIVLRKAKRLSSNIRAEFSTATGRKNYRTDFIDLLTKSPLSVDCFDRFIWHLNDCFPEQQEDAEDVVLGRGYF